MTNKKSLQKITDIEDLKTVKQTKEYLVENPDAKSDLWDSLTNRISENFAEELGNDFNLTNMLIATLDDEKVIEDVRNTTYDANHRVITSYIHNYILENRCFPSMSQIKSGTKLSRQTIYNHLKDGINSKHNKLVKGANEIMSLSALSKLYLIGIEDRNASALKHFIQLSGVVNNNTTSVNNFIQINNLKISNEDFNNLPQDDILEIESIVSKSMQNKV